MKRKIVLGTIPVVAILLIWLVWIRFIATTKTMESSLKESIPLERISSFDLTLISLLWVAVIFSIVYFIQKRMGKKKSGKS